MLLLAAHSNGGAGVEVSADSGAPVRTTDATDDDSSWSRRQKPCKHRVDLPSLAPPSSSASIPPSPRRLANPYTLYSMLRKKVSIRDVVLETVFLFSRPHVGPGYPLYAFAPPLSIHFIFCSFLCFSLFPFLIHFTYFLLLSIHPILPESSHSISRPEVVGGDRNWV